MAKLLITDIFDEIKQENNRLMNELIFIQKNTEFLECFQKLCTDFNKNCVCNQNIDNKTYFCFLIDKYQRYVDNNNIKKQTEIQEKINKTYCINQSKNNFKVNKKVLKVSDLSKSTLIVESNKQIKTYSKKDEIIGVVQKPVQNPNNDKNEFEFCSVLLKKTAKSDGNNNKTLVKRKYNKRNQNKTVTIDLDDCEGSEVITCKTVPNNEPKNKSQRFETFLTQIKQNIGKKQQNRGSSLLKNKKMSKSDNKFDDTDKYLVEHKNKMERKRREVLNHWFQVLDDELPKSITGVKPKMNRIKVIENAIRIINRLKTIESNLDIEKQKQIIRKQLLENQVKGLGCQPKVSNKSSVDRSVKTVNTITLQPIPITTDQISHSETISASGFDDFVHSNVISNSEQISEDIDFVVYEYV